MSGVRVPRLLQRVDALVEALMAARSRDAQ